LLALNQQLQSKQHSIPSADSGTMPSSSFLHQQTITSHICYEMLHKLHYYWLLLLLDGLKKKVYKLKSRAPYIPIRTGVLCNKIIQITAFLCIMAVLTIIFCLQNPKIFIACQFDRHVNFWIFKTKNYFQKNFWTKSIGPYNIHTPYWRCLYHVFYFILTRNYSMKTSLQQQESFVIRVRLSP